MIVRVSAVSTHLRGEREFTIQRATLGGDRIVVLVVDLEVDNIRRSWCDDAVRSIGVGRSVRLVRAQDDLGATGRDDGHVDDVEVGEVEPVGSGVWNIGICLILDGVNEDQPALG